MMRRLDPSWSVRCTRELLDVNRRAGAVKYQVPHTQLQTRIERCLHLDLVATSMCAGKESCELATCIMAFSSWLTSRPEHAVALVDQKA